MREVTLAFKILLIPFSLVPIREGKVVLFEEDQDNVEQLLKDYENFKVHLRRLVQAAFTFIRNTVTGEVFVSDQGFSRFVGQSFSNVLSLYNDVTKKAFPGSSEIFTLIQNAYFAYLMVIHITEHRYTSLQSKSSWLLSPVN